MSTEFGTDLSLPNVSVLWKGVSGLSFDSVADIICDLRSKYPHQGFWSSMQVEMTLVKMITHYLDNKSL